MVRSGAARRAELRRQLAGPVRLVSLTPLGTRAMRERMLAEGREAVLVGEVAGAAPAEMLGVVAEHYTNASAAEARPLAGSPRHPDAAYPPEAAPLRP